MSSLIPKTNTNIGSLSPNTSVATFKTASVIFPFALYIYTPKTIPINVIITAIIIPTINNFFFFIHITFFQITLPLYTKFNLEYYLILSLFLLYLSFVQ